MKLRVLTQNLRNICDRYEERKQMLREQISQADADLCGFQEVVFSEQPRQLFNNCQGDQQQSKMQILNAPLQKNIVAAGHDDFLIEGNSVAIKTSQKIKIVSQNQILHLQEHRNASRVQIQVNTSKIRRGRFTLQTLIQLIWTRIGRRELNNSASYSNGYPICKSIIESCRITNSMKSKDCAIIMTGDFNMNSYEQGYGMMLDKGFKSCFKVANGAQPGKTFPSGLWDRNMDTDQSLCADYIWVKAEQQSVYIQSAKLISYKGKQFVENPESSIFPSDHFGIVADIIVN